MLQEKVRQLDLRIEDLEEEQRGMVALVNKSWGGVAVVFLIGTIAGGIVAFWGNIQKILGH